MKGSSSFSFDRLNFDHPKVNAVTTLVHKNIKEISYLLLKFITKCYIKYSIKCRIPVISFQFE